MWSRKPKCTCQPGKFMTLTGTHYLSCDLMYIEGKSKPRRKKRFFFFYPLKNVKEK